MTDADFAKLVLTEAHCVVLGNAIDGLSIFGPFETLEAAQSWAEACKDDWVITDLQAPLVDQKVPE